MLLARFASSTIGPTLPSSIPYRPSFAIPISRLSPSSHVPPASAVAPPAPVSARATSPSFRTTASSAPPHAARTFASITPGSSAAHTTPCGTGKFAPTGAANPWTAPSPAFVSVTPLMSAACAIPSRASTSAPFSQAPRPQHPG